MADRDDFLRTVAERIPFGAAERGEILEELRSHLDDTTAGLAGTGLDSIDAERVALERLGAPERLADELVRARRNPARLLAAAGVGAVTIVGTGIYGLLLGFVVALLGSLAAMLVFVILQGFGISAWTAAGQEFSAALGFLTFGITLYLVGRNLTPAVAERAGYPARPVARLTAVIGAALVGVWALAGRTGPLDWISLVILLSLPAWWVAGAWRGRRLLGRREVLLRPIVLGLVVAIGLTLVLTAVARPPSFGATVGGGIPDWGVDRIAPAASGAVAAAAQASGGTMSVGAGVTSIGVVFDQPLVLSGWTDLRIEAWRAVAPAGQQPTSIDERADGPFVTGPVGWTTAGAVLAPEAFVDSGDLSPSMPALFGALDLSHWPGIPAAWFAITGIGPDGVRRAISGAEYETLAFDGTALDWIAAVAAGR